ncbi:MAG: bifunctional aconitate hydratase 2/2-methylisocitrate dehydratase [Spirochaetia bacterium]|nr:bifunctional aconitate hydratase 2/2-methylisocitrate dehydratase [Spirochaetia bacterium]
MNLLNEYQAHIEERNKEGIPPLPLSNEQTTAVIDLLKSGHAEGEKLKDMLFNRVNPGVDEAAKIKAEFLNEIIQDKIACEAISKNEAVEALGNMLGGYNVPALVNALKVNEAAKAAEEALKKTLLVYESFNDIIELSKSNPHAKSVLDSWANAEWFTKRPKLPEKLTVTVFKVPGETNTDDLSPASQAFTRSDIPLHANSMLISKMPEGLKTIADLKSKGNLIAYVGDVVGTGSSRKSGVNSVQWHMGEDIPGVPNKRTGGVVIGGVIAPIFFATCEDSGALPIEVDVTQLETGDVIDIYPNEGKIEKDGNEIAKFSLKPNTIADEFRAGGRVPLIIGRDLTKKAREALGLGEIDLFMEPEQPADDGKGYTLAQKMVGKACGKKGVKPGTYVEVKTETVASQDTTGAMTRDEIKELAALGFSADLVLQSFCHTAAYPKPADIKLHGSLPQFITSRSGISLKPGDGVIHSWVNRMVLPDTVGTGADSHTRFPIGISFPGGSGLVAFAAVTGVMPLTMPESVLVKFSGKLQPGITLRDLVNAIPYVAIKKGLLTVPKKNKVNVFNGTIIEIEGLPDLKVEQAFELSDASAERSAAACTVRLNKEPVIEYIKSNVTLLESMLKAGYENKKTIQKRIDKMKAWLENPVLMEPDADAQYKAVIEINMDEITEPILACPNDPDDVATLSEVQADSNREKKIDEVFVGSCMTNIGHYRAAAEILRNETSMPSKLWIAPPTKMDEKQLKDDKYYDVFNTAGAQLEVPGCSLCMGNQARVADNAVVFSTSTRNFDNRLGNGAQVYLGSAELAAVTARFGRIPTKEEYLSSVNEKIDGKETQIYKYLNFNEIENYQLTER